MNGWNLRVFWPPGKGNSSSKPSFLGSMFNLRGGVDREREGESIQNRVSKMFFVIQTCFIAKIFDTNESERER